MTTRNAVLKQDDNLEPCNQYNQHLPQLDEKRIYCLDENKRHSLQIILHVSNTFFTSKVGVILPKFRIAFVDGITIPAHKIKYMQRATGGIKDRIQNTIMSFSALVSCLFILTNPSKILLEGQIETYRQVRLM